MFLILLGCVFLAVGYWMLSQPAAKILSLRRSNSPLVVHGAGLLSLALGCLGIAPWLRRIVVTSGLVIDDLGFTDESSPLAAGFIAWSQIKGFRVLRTERQKILYVILDDPAEYIAGARLVKRTLLRAIDKLGGSPVFITTSSLAVDFDELVRLMNDGLTQYRRARLTNHSSGRA